MAILIDPPMWPAHGTLFSHLVSDSDYDELHLFARHLGMPRRAFDLDHYDVPASLHEQAVVLGARPVSAKDVVHALRDSRLRVRQVEREKVTPLRRRQYLLSEWSQLGSALGLAEHRNHDDWHGLGTELLTRWNEPHRSYHDEQHLEDVLLALDHLSVRGERLSPAPCSRRGSTTRSTTESPGPTSATQRGLRFAPSHASDSIQGSCSRWASSSSRRCPRLRSRIRLPHSRICSTRISPSSPRRRIAMSGTRLRCARNMRMCPTRISRLGDLRFLPRILISLRSTGAVSRGSFGRGGRGRI